MKRCLFLFLGLMSMLFTLRAGTPVQQKFLACCFDSKDSQFTSFPSGLAEMRRGAYPYKNRAIVLDLFRPTKVDRVVIPLEKFEIKHQDNQSEADRMQVYAGMTPDKLDAVAGAKVVVAAGNKNGVPMETITVTELPEARYLLFYAPRTDRLYVFGIQDARNNIQVWADAQFAMDPKIVALPDASTLDSKWARAALTIESCGFCDMQDEAEGETAAYQGAGGGSQLGWPWKKRFVEVAIKEPQPVARIVFDLLKMQTQFSEMTTGLEDAVVYQSEDGKSFRQVAAKAEHLLYRKGQSILARVTLNGDFTGKYFRIYVPWKKSYYVFGTKRLNTAVKVFAPTGLSVSEVALPLYATGREFAVAFRLDAPAGATGTVELKSTGDVQETLWSQKVTPDMLGKKNTFDVKLELPLAEGCQEFRLAAFMPGQKKPYQATIKIWATTKVVALKPQSAENWKATTAVIGADSKAPLVSTVANATLEYAVPLAGDYAFYLLQIGKSKMKYQINDLSGEAALETWHPEDLAVDSAGINFLCAGTFAIGDKLQITAPGADCAVGELLMIPMSQQQKDALNVASTIKPVAILHSDGYSDFYSQDITPAYLDERIDAAKRGKAFAFDWCIGTTAVNYPSKIASNFGTQKDYEAPREGDRKAIVRLQNLFKQCDPIQHLVKYAKQESVRFSVTIRANPFYTPLNSHLNSQYFIDRPHCLLRRLDGTTGYPQLSYAHEDTRHFFLEIAKEVAAYQPDAIVLEYLRHPPFFGFDEPLKQEYARRFGSCDKKDFNSLQWQKMCADIMTEHIRNVRRAIDKVNPKIALELSCDWAKYYQHGIDLETLLKEGLVDVLSPGVYEIGTQKYFPLAPFRELIAKSPKKVLLIPRVEGTIYGGDPTVAEEKGLEVILRRSMSVNMFRALWLRFEKESADGLRSFNTGGGWLAAALADPAELRRFEAFQMPLLDFRTKMTQIQK